eukprot:COSAG04_NODE_1227_length_7681_cov_5.724083_8_plen_213_part_00
MAAFAFSVAFARVHLMQKAYRPPAGEYEARRASGQTQCTAASYTATARRNYADGLVHGLHGAVSASLTRREEQRTAKLRRAQSRAERWRKAQARGARDGEGAEGWAYRGEAYDEDEDDGGDGGWHGGDDASDSSSDDDGDGGGAADDGCDGDDYAAGECEPQLKQEEGAGAVGAAGGGGVKVEEALAAAEQRLSKLQRSYVPSTFCRSKDAT